jgi:hypothetical protein
MESAGWVPEAGMLEVTRFLDLEIQSQEEIQVKRLEGVRGVDPRKVWEMEGLVVASA